MEKVRIGNNIAPYPMPVTLVGALSNGTPNFMAVSWITRVNNNPPLIAVAINRTHITHHAIKENETFSINIPGEELMLKTDYCGIKSGNKVDKSKLFDVFYGELETAPMIKNCAINIECALVDTIAYETNELFVGQIIQAFSEDKYLTDGKPDPAKIRQFTLTMPDNTYRSMGEPIGKAWKSGLELDKEL